MKLPNTITLAAAAALVLAGVFVGYLTNKIREVQ